MDGDGEREGERGREGESEEMRVESSRHRRMNGFFRGGGASW